MSKKGLSIEQTIYRLLIARAKNKKHGHQAALKRYKLLEYLMKKREFLYRLAENAARIKSNQPSDPGNQVPDRYMRRICRRMKKDGYRIGSTADLGYFYVKTREDLALSTGAREKQKRALQQDITWERRNFANKDQRRLFKKRKAA